MIQRGLIDMQQSGTIAIVQRDCDGLLIPTAIPITIPSGTQVVITQMMGGAYTLNVNGNLVRVEGKDHEALGFDTPPADASVVRHADNKIAEGPVDLDQVWARLKTCYDPEIPVNIVDLGLIYGVEVSSSDDGKANLVEVKMTLTAPGCGMGPIIAGDVELKILSLPNVTDVKVELVLDPPWTQDKMSDAAKLELGLL